MRLWNPRAHSNQQQHNRGMNWTVNKIEVWTKTWIWRIVNPLLFRLVSSSQALLLPRLSMCIWSLIHRRQQSRQSPVPLWSAGHSVAEEPNSLRWRPSWKKPFIMFLLIKSGPHCHSAESEALWSRSNCLPSQWMADSRIRGKEQWAEGWC